MRINVGAAIGLAKGFCQKGVCARRRQHRISLFCGGLTGQAGSRIRGEQGCNRCAHKGARRRVGGGSHSGQLCGSRSRDNRNGPGAAGDADTGARRGPGGDASARAWQCSRRLSCHRFLLARDGSLDYRVRSWWWTAVIRRIRRALVKRLLIVGAGGFGREVCAGRGTSEPTPVGMEDRRIPGRQRRGSRRLRRALRDPGRPAEFARRKRTCASVQSAIRQQTAGSHWPAGSRSPVLNLIHHCRYYGGKLPRSVRAASCVRARS